MSTVRFQCPHCNHVTDQPFEMLGQLIDCPACGETVEVQKSPIKLPPPPHIPHVPPKLKMPKPPPGPRKLARGKEYKVLTPSDKAFAGEFSPEKLEQVLNAFAAHGWRVVSVVNAPTPAGLELMVVLGRDK